MNNFKQRDEIGINRLSSFFLIEGGLEISKMTPIKRHVLYIENNAGIAFILKKHQKLERIKQQWIFFSQIEALSLVSFQKFPNGRKVLIDGSFYWTIAPFIEGRKLNYKNKQDRSTAVDTLHNFHNYAKHIYIPQPIKKDQFLIRWAQRMNTFKKTEHFFHGSGFEMLYKDIVQTTALHLKSATKLTWDMEEAEAQRNGQWIHGDVASHNFIQNEQTYMIDFDLLACGTQLYDYIQLGQRFLPYINWDFDELLSYNMVTKKDMEKWLSAILIPSDVIREWLFFLSQGSSPISQYLSQMEKAWLKRHFFLKNAKLMLKSI